MTDKYYTGVGIESGAPMWVLDMATEIGSRLAKKGYTLRHGGRVGVDEAFVNGALAGFGTFEAWIPNDDLPMIRNQRSGKRWRVSTDEVYQTLIYLDSHNLDRTLMLADQYKRQVAVAQAYTAVGDASFTRYRQHSEFVIYYGPEDVEDPLHHTSTHVPFSAYPSLVVQVAIDRKLPVFNIGNEEDRDTLKTLLGLTTKVL